MTNKVKPYRLTIKLHPDSVKEFKKKAIDANMTVSKYLSIAGTITPASKIVKYQDTVGSATQK